MNILGPSKGLLGSNVTFSVSNAHDTSLIKWFKDGNQITLLETESPVTLNLYDIGYPAAGTYWAEYDGVKSNEIKFSIVDYLATQFRYIAPLPWRKAGFIWIGWWVLDEIKEALIDKFNWVDDPMNDRFTYKEDMSTLAWGFNTYDNLEVQESRNGYILGREELIDGHSIIR